VIIGAIMLSDRGLLACEVRGTKGDVTVGHGDELSLSDLERDPDPLLARMRAEEPVCWVPALDMYLVTRWDDVAAMEADPDRFTAATEPSFLARTLGTNMLTTDPPAHTRLREIMIPPFQARGRSGEFASDELAGLADRLIDGIDPTGFDVMVDYAQPLSAGSLAMVLGLDAHGMEAMWCWCEGLCTDLANFENDPQLTAVGERTKADLGAAIDGRIAAVGEDGRDEHDDERSAIAWFVRHGATHEEIVNNVRLTISGGINEPRDGIGLVIWVLLTRPALRHAVEAEPAKWRRLVEEVLRVYSPVGTITRQATEDLELGGVEIEAGRLVSGVLRSVNLDDEHFSAPHEIDLDRHEGPHAAFALGVHRCLGEWLGRQEVRIGSQRLLERFPDLELEPGHDVELHGFEFRGPRALRVRASA
jgi:cytochrome P450